MSNPLQCTLPERDTPGTESTVPSVQAPPILSCASLLRMGGFTMSLSHDVEIDLKNANCEHAVPVCSSKDTVTQRVVKAVQPSREGIAA